MTCGQYKPAADMSIRRLRRYNTVDHPPAAVPVSVPDSDTAPKPDEEAVSARALLVRCEKRTPGAGGYSRLLARLVSEELITANDASTYAGQPPAEAVAELIAQVRAVDAIADARARSGEEP
ncbi:hypothetical protein AB0H71_17065 [Nocardia sp. NPDC050697]|uniref:hypothetical protein n=1 Tax=Nocardia sp. NPDC050697 TaxID=3155158 RepID=UPI0033FB8440